MKERRRMVVAFVCAFTVFGLLAGLPPGEGRGEQAAPGGKPTHATQGEYTLKIPFGLEETAVVIPADNPLTKEKVELGRLLFFD
ncbi:MAG TPA: hypothetical protein VI359_08610, partial [Nitrospiraceae bacterium]